METALARRFKHPKGLKRHHIFRTGTLEPHRPGSAGASALGGAVLEAAFHVLTGEYAGRDRGPGGPPEDGIESVPGHVRVEDFVLRSTLAGAPLTGRHASRQTGRDAEGEQQGTLEMHHPNAPWNHKCRKF